MPLNDTFPRSVAFVVGWRTDPEGIRQQSAIGTAFFVAVPATTGNHGWIYVVTAAHVVEFERETWVRVRTKDGSLGLVAVPEWTQHATADVAVAYVNVANALDITWIPMSSFLDVWPNRPTLGDQVYFIGLLEFADSMVEENVPMVRSGTLGRMYQERVALRHGDKRTTRHQAHLIDCRSYAGFSGSPCFVQFQGHQRPGQSGVFVGGVSLVPETVCLGLISGHWDDLAQAEVGEDLASDPVARGIQVRINTGVGIVTPVEKIRECLMDDELVQARIVRDAHVPPEQP
jgi:hypothetical protein